MSANTKTSTVALSEKSIEYILSSLGTKDSNHDDHRKLIEATLAQVNNHLNRKKSFADFIVDTASSQDAITKRLAFIRTVAGNTLKKMTHGHPKELEWARLRGEMSFVGFFVKVPSFNRTFKYTNITDQIVSGNYDVSDPKRKESILVRFTVAGSTFSIPLSVFVNDPITVAQYVRKECREFAVSNEYAMKRELKRQKEQLQRDHDNLQRDLERKMDKVENEMKRITPIKAKNKDSKKASKKNLATA